MKKPTLNKIAKLARKKQESSLNPNEIHMNYNTFKYIQEKYSGNYIDLTLPCQILGMNVKIENKLKDNEIMVLDSSKELSLTDLEKAKRDVAKHEQEIWAKVEANRIKNQLLNENSDVKSTLDLSKYFDNGEIRLEVIDGIENIMNQRRQILPIIRLNQFVLTEETLFDSKDLNKLVLRNVFLQLDKLHKELRSKI